MSAVTDTIVREYFELHGFFVRQQRKYVPHTRREEDEIDFYVINPLAEPVASRSFELTSADLRGIARAVVLVKGWHTDTISPKRLAREPDMFRCLEPGVFPQATQIFGIAEPPVKLLVVPAFPADEEARQETIALLQSKGIDAVIPFRTLLADLIAQIEDNRNYQKSDLLQVLRIVKTYEFLRDMQLELFKDKRKRRRR